MKASPFIGVFIGQCATLREFNFQTKNVKSIYKFLFFNNISYH
jgi:hypothetical protein